VPRHLSGSAFTSVPLHHHCKDSRSDEAYRSAHVENGADPDIVHEDPPDQRCDDHADTKDRVVGAHRGSHPDGPACIDRQSHDGRLLDGAPDAHGGGDHEQRPERPREGDDGERHRGEQPQCGMGIPEPGHARGERAGHDAAAHVPEDRQQDGLVLDFAVSDNLILNTYYRPPFARGIGLQRDVIDASARQLVQDFDVRTPGIDTAVGNLSGGNQQKVIVAREFNRPIQLLIASQPTRGLDVGSIEYIHSRIIAQRDGGAGVLLISSELDEVMQLADRILVMFRGELMADLPADEAGRDQLGLLMAGVSNAQAQPQPEEVSGS